MTPEVKPQIEVSSSIGNFLDKSHHLPFIWTAEKFASVANESGYDGLEWLPFRILATFQIKRGFLSQRSREAVKSLHQSYRGEKSLREAWNHPNRTLALVSYFLLPERISSLAELEKIQRGIGRQLPAVLYPSLSAEDDIDRPFAEKTFQPAPEVMEQWGVKSADGLIDEMYKRSYTGFCLDLLHFRRPGRVNLIPWQETLLLLLPHTKEIQISAGRFDVLDKSVDTDAELRDLLTGTSDTDLPKMLKVIREFKWNGLVVVEIPTASIFTSISRILETRRLIQAHQRITESVRNLLS